MEDKRLSSSLEDYLEAIYSLSQDQSFAHANKIATFLGVSKSSVSWALKQLSNKKLVNYTPYEVVTLTDKGRLIAERVSRRHEDIKTFLTDVLAINENIAEENACRLEHVLDRPVLTRMRQFMEFLQQCPRLGDEWMKGFGIFCGQGKQKEHCAECLAECLAKLPQQLPDAPAQPAGDRDVSPEHRRRDQGTIERLAEVLDECGRPFTPAQRIVADVFISSDSHKTEKQLLSRAGTTDTTVTAQDVDTTLRLLCEHKIARALRFQDHVVYEHFHPESHHDHIFCVRCGCIVEFFDPRIEALQVEDARRSDFRLLMHTLNIYGLCKDCIKQQARTLPLTDCLPGDDVKVVQIVADTETQKRVAQMGLTPGAAVHVLNTNCVGGNTIVMAHGTRLMIDCETAQRINVASDETTAPSAGSGLARPRGRRRHHAPEEPMSRQRRRFRNFGGDGTDAPTDKDSTS